MDSAPARAELEGLSSRTLRNLESLCRRSGVVYDAWMKFRFISFAFVWLLATCGSAPAQFGEFGAKAGAVKTSIVADTKAVEAGKPFTVGVRFEIKREWDIYWRFVGDIGLPTSVEWELPAGFKAGPLQWPVPKAHLAPGDILNYVYENEALLFAEITPPTAMPTDPVAIKAKVAWQMCNAEMCVPGNADVALSLPVGSATPDNADLFAKWRAQIPKTAGAPFQVKWHREKADEFSIEITGLPKEFSAEFFPLPPNREAKPGHPKVSEIAADGARTITFPMEGGAPNLPWQGVIVTSKGDAPREGWHVAADAQSAPASPSKPALIPPSGTSLFTTLWAAFLGGLILNVMPCVLPVIALKIFGFISQANEEPRQVFRLGLAFVAGVFAFFLMLAALVVAIRAGGGRFNFGFQFQNVRVLTALIAIVFVFAMSMFGVFEITLGSATATKLDALSGRKGYGGAFAHGLFTTLLGTSCTGPFIGPVLGFAVVQPPHVVVAIFLAIAAGMSLPYFLLTWQPAWMKYLPKPGMWMERMKQFMGFVLMALVVWLLGILGGGRGVDALIAVSGFLLVLGVACWAFGAVHRRIVAWPVAIALAAVGWFAFLQDTLDAAPAKTGEPKTAIKPGGIPWEPFTPERLKQALESGRPVFIDFTADWCWNCKYNEKVVLETEPVRAAFREKKIIALKADWTNGDPVITNMLKEFNRAGVPVYVIYLPGSPEPVVLPEILTQSVVLRYLADIKS